MVEKALQNQASISDMLKVKANRKALIYTCTLAIFQQLTGINFLLFYMQDIFISTNSIVPAKEAPIIIGVVQMLASAVTPMVVDKWGRKILLVLSGIGEAVSLVSDLPFLQTINPIISRSSQIQKRASSTNCTGNFKGAIRVRWNPLRNLIPVYPESSRSRRFSLVSSGIQ